MSTRYLSGKYVIDIPTQCKPDEYLWQRFKTNPILHLRSTAPPSTRAQFLTRF